MNSKIKTAFTLTLAPLVLGLLAVSGTISSLAYKPRPGAAGSQRPPQHFVPQPSTWTAFDAKLVVYQAGKQKVEGRYYRRIDGSWRDEQSRDDGATFISICNVADAMGYFFNGITNEWSRRPMVLPASGYKPSTRPVVMEHLTRSEPIEGLEIYKRVDASGVETLEAVDLNFIAVVTVDPRENTRRVLSEFQLRPQRDELFTPPVGVAVRFIDKPIYNGVPSRRHAR